MEVTTLRAHARAETGSKAVRHLRAEGKVPAVLYGQGKDPVNLTVDAHTLSMELKQRRKVFTLDTGSGKESAYVQEVQYDAMTDAPTHVDFRRIDIDKPLRLEVALSFIGVPEGLSKGGVLIKDRTTVWVHSMPTAIPKVLEVKIAALGLGQTITAKDIELPQGVTLDIPTTAKICHIPAHD